MDGVRPSLFLDLMSYAVGIEEAIDGLRPFRSALEQDAISDEIGFDYAIRALDDNLPAWKCASKL